MPKKRANTSLKSWMYEKDHNSKWAMIHGDLMKSQAFLALSRQEQLFYIVCRVNATDGTGRKALQHISEETARARNEDVDSFVQERMSGDYFVMPAKQVEEYGYTRQRAYKLMQGLIEAGFVDRVESNGNQWKINVYRFSNRWKKNISR